jgi:Recombination endonuclease VII
VTTGFTLTADVPGGLVYKRLNGDEKKALIEQAGNVCAMCGSDNNLVIDHDHSTGFVRGVLCNRCNARLGQFESFSVAWMRSAVAYLKTDHAQYGLKFIREYFDHQHRDLMDELDRINREDDRVRKNLMAIENRKRALLEKLQCGS